MKEQIAEFIRESRTLSEMQEAIIKLIFKLRAENVTRVGYVAGVVSSDGMEKIPANLARLDQYVLLMSQRYSDAVFFSAAQVFTPEVYGRLVEFRLPKPERELAFMEFWRGIFKSKSISDVSFTPRWRKSAGASDEHQVATEIALPHQFIMQIRPQLLLVRTCCR